MSYEKKSWLIKIRCISFRSPQFLLFIFVLFQEHPENTDKSMTVEELVMTGYESLGKWQKKIKRENNTQLLFFDLPSHSDDFPFSQLVLSLFIPTQGLFIFDIGHILLLLWAYNKTEYIPLKI